MINLWKTKVFQKWQKKNRISDEMLAYAVEEMKQGLINADLGSGVLKKRIAREGSGKSSGYRTLVTTNRGDKWFFIYGFSKNERENLDVKELLSQGCPVLIKPLPFLPSLRGLHFFASRSNPQKSLDCFTRYAGSQ